MSRDMLAARSVALEGMFQEMPDAGGRGALPMQLAQSQVPLVFREPISWFQWWQSQCESINIVLCNSKYIQGVMV